MIHLECDCGKRFRVGDDQAGRKVRCPACQDLVRVPGKAKEGGGYGVEAVRKCPKCKTEWPEKTVVCTNCGWDFRKGKAMKTRYQVGEREVASGGSVLFLSWVMIVQRAEDGDLLLITRYYLWGLPIRRRETNLTGYTHLVTDFAAGGEDMPDRYYVAAEGPKKRRVVLYSGSDQEVMHEIIDALVALAGLEVTRR